jgi:hypothetical protein
MQRAGGEHISARARAARLPKSLAGVLLAPAVSRRMRETTPN